MFENSLFVISFKTKFNASISLPGSKILLLSISCIFFLISFVSINLLYIDSFTIVLDINFLILFYEPKFKIASLLLAILKSFLYP